MTRRRRNPATGRKPAADRGQFYITIKVPGEAAKNIGPYPTKRAANVDGKSLLYLLRDQYGYSADDTNVTTQYGKVNPYTGRKEETGYSLVDDATSDILATVTTYKTGTGAYGRGIIGSKRRKRSKRKSS